MDARRRGRELVTHATVKLTAERRHARPAGGRAARRRRRRLRSAPAAIRFAGRRQRAHLRPREASDDNQRRRRDGDVPRLGVGCACRRGLVQWCVRVPSLFKHSSPTTRGSETLTSTGHVGTWNVLHALRTSDTAPLPDTYTPVALAAISSVCVGRVPPVDSEAEPMYGDDPYLLVFSSLDGSTGLLDMRDPAGTLTFCRSRSESQWFLSRSSTAFPKGISTLSPSLWASSLDEGQGRASSSPARPFRPRLATSARPR